MSKLGIMEVLSNEPLAKDVHKMVVKGEIADAITNPGQFMNIKLEDGYNTYLRRPMSISDYNGDEVTFIYKVVGKGTKLLTEKKPGDKLDILMGLGNGFTVDPSIKKALIIGGGVGVPPMYKLAKLYHEAGVEVETVLGFNSKCDVFYEEQFAAFGPCHIATMDGSYGEQGNVIDVMKKFNISYDKYYACGPERMLDALVKNDDQNGFLSFEARMGCGFGACMGCSCKVKTKPYKRICVEGPVLSSSEVIINE